MAWGRAGGAGSREHKRAVVLSSRLIACQVPLACPRAPKCFGILVARLRRLAVAPLQTGCPGPFLRTPCTGRKGAGSCRSRGRWGSKGSGQWCAHSWGCTGGAVVHGWGDTCQGARVTVAALGGVLVRLRRRPGGYVDSIALWGVTLFQWTSSALSAAGELSVCRRRAWVALLLPRDPPAAWGLGGPGSSFVSWLLCCLSPLRWGSQVLSRAGSWLPQGKQSPSVPPDCARPPGAQRMAKEFMLPPGDVVFSLL